jgi:ADP-L-glycero-D-manno-heptose 6-epimerase
MARAVQKDDAMIVVTGGAGFIGSNLVAALAAETATGGPDIVVVDHLGTDDKWRNLAKHEIADLIAPDALFAFLNAHKAEIELIFHLGASSSTTETDVDFIMAQNFRLSLDLWNWCSQHNTRLIYASSAATYGDGGQGFDDDNGLTALGGLKPLNPYGWSKHLFDRRVMRLISNATTPPPPQWAGLKFFNVYGPNEYHKGGQMSVVAHLHPKIAAGQPAVLFKSHRDGIADGGQMRDFIWVGDCVDVMLWLRDTPDVNGIFNVGTGKARSFADLAAAVFAANGLPTTITYIDTPEAIRDKYQYFTEANTHNLRAAGYQGQFTTLEDGVDRYVTGFLNADDRYR